MGKEQLANITPLKVLEFATLTVPLGAVYAVHKLRRITRSERANGAPEDPQLPSLMDRLQQRRRR